MNTLPSQFTLLKQKKTVLLISKQNCVVMKKLRRQGGIKMVVQSCITNITDSREANKGTLIEMAVGLVLVAALVQSQCITQFDDLTPPNYVDLQHVLPFSIRLFKELLPYSGNFLMSPYSIWNTLVMTYFGTNGETQVQMEKVLQLTNKMDTLALYKSLSQHIQL